MITNSPRASNEIVVSDLSISAGGVSLLEDVNVRFKAGAITLVVGPSGVGKTVFLRSISAVGNDPEVHASGRITIGDRPVKSGSIGVVFQDFALFEELTPKGNIDFALAHARRANSERRNSDEWMRELDIPRDTRTRNLSGGQRQRLAIARALASHPQALVYDEPTSGLDPQTADQVANLIRETANQHSQTTIIVTHDYRSLVPIADEIFVVDPMTRTLIPVERSEWNRLDETLQCVSESIRTARQPKSMGQRIGHFVGGKLERFFSGTTVAVAEVLTLLWSLLPAWRSLRWGPYYLIHYLRLIAGPSAWLYLAVAGMILGFVTTYFTFRFLPYASYTEPLLIDNLLGAMGFALYRILVPILATVLIAARCGAAVASDIGGKRYGRQLEAFQSLRVRPRSYLLTGELHAFLLGTPLLVGLAYFFASLTSLAVFAWIHPELGPDYWRLHYHRELSVAGETFFIGTGWLFAKLLVCAAGIALIAYHRGAAPKSSPSDVSRAVTSTILWTTLYVLIVHFVFAFFEFEVTGGV